MAVLLRDIIANGLCVVNTVEVPYNYYILNVKLTNRPINSFVSELLTAEQLEMYQVYLETSGNKPLIFGGGSPDVSASEDLSGVQFVNGTRPGNTAIVDIAKRQVGNVGGQPYWSWYGFNSRVEWRRWTCLTRSFICPSCVWT